jgi:hypothetical protein
MSFQSMPDSNPDSDPDPKVTMKPDPDMDPKKNVLDPKHAIHKRIFLPEQYSRQKFRILVNPDPQYCFTSICTYKNRQ